MRHRWICMYVCVRIYICLDASFQKQVKDRRNQTLNIESDKPTNFSMHETDGQIYRSIN